MPNVLVVIRDSNNNVIPGATASWGGHSATSDSTGTANLSLNGAQQGQSISVYVTAPGFFPADQNYLVTQYTGVLTFALVVSSSPLKAKIKISDGTNPVAYAGAYINGAGAAISDEQGIITIALKQGQNQIQITCEGYLEYNGGFNSSAPPDIIVLRPDPNATHSQILTFVSSPPGAEITIGGEDGILSASGTYQTQNSFPPGVYNVTLAYKGQSTNTSVTVVPGTATYQLSPVPVTDDGLGVGLQTVNVNGAASPSPSQPGTVATSTSAPTSPSLGIGVISQDNGVPDYEFVNPNANHGRYFTATQARMYIGNLFIEELAGCQFVLQENKAPVYGYASTKFDAIGDGRGLVQGQIMIHFISEGYLYTVLNEFKRSSSSVSLGDQQAFQNLVATQQQLQASGSTDPAVLNQIATLKTQRQQMLAANPELATTYKKSLLNTATTAIGPNAVYRRTPFDLVVEFEGGGRTVTRRIKNCILTSNEQILGDNDSPLIDSYGFIARELQ